MKLVEQLAFFFTTLVSIYVIKFLSEIFESLASLSYRPFFRVLNRFSKSSFWFYTSVVLGFEFMRAFLVECVFSAAHASLLAAQWVLLVGYYTAGISFFTLVFCVVKENRFALVSAVVSLYEFILKFHIFATNHWAQFCEDLRKYRCPPVPVREPVPYAYLQSNGRFRVDGLTEAEACEARIKSMREECDARVAKAEKERDEVKAACEVRVAEMRKKYEAWASEKCKAIKAKERSDCDIRIANEKALWDAARGEQVRMYEDLIDREKTAAAARLVKMQNTLMDVILKLVHMVDSDRSILVAIGWILGFRFHTTDTIESMGCSISDYMELYRGGNAYHVRLYAELKKIVDKIMFIKFDCTPPVFSAHEQKMKGRETVMKIAKELGLKIDKTMLTRKICKRVLMEIHPDKIANLPDEVRAKYEEIAKIVIEITVRDRPEME